MARRLLLTAWLFRSGQNRDDAAGIPDAVGEPDKIHKTLNGIAGTVLENNVLTLDPVMLTYDNTPDGQLFIQTNIDAEKVMTGADVYDCENLTNYPLTPGAKTWASTVTFAGPYNWEPIQGVAANSTLRYVQSACLAKAVELGAQIVFGSPAKVLVQNENGDVTGVIGFGLSGLRCKPGGGAPFFQSAAREQPSCTQEVAMGIREQEEQKRSARRNLYAPLQEGPLDLDEIFRVMVESIHDNYVGFPGRERRFMPNEYRTYILSHHRTDTLTLQMLARRCGKKVTTVGRPTMGTLDTFDPITVRLHEHMTLSYPIAMSASAREGRGVAGRGLPVDRYVRWTPAEIGEDILLREALAV